MGNTGRKANPGMERPVHPHTHGEHIYSDNFPIIIAGSSPHAWGTPDRAFLPRKFHRFIPTRMGNTKATIRLCPTSTVHPHTHGEHSTSCWRAWTRGGSSPHAWGTHDIFPPVPPLRRFIPTRMGNTRGRCGSAPGRSVHPHTHGEHPRPHTSGPRSVGSSPHAWGTR